LKTFIADTPEYERLLPHVKGNVGFVFTNEDLKEVRDVILANKVAAPARAGALAPADVYVPAGNTGMEPGKTSFFQALGVPTKIARGTIEITTDLKLVEAGSKVGASEATLLNMLNISPFTYGMGISQVYDQGQSFPPSVLDVGEEQLLKTLSSAINTIATISLALNFPTLPSVLHSVINSYKKVLAVAISTEISWPEIEQLKDRIANPDAYASAAPTAAAGAATDAPAEEEKKDESEEEEDDEGFGGLLYVHPSHQLQDKTNKRTATKCSHIMMMYDCAPELWLGLRLMDLKKGVHRSSAGQLNLSRRLQITRTLQHACDRMLTRLTQLYR
jgi:large subunit ribosomal protein LP0